MVVLVIALGAAGITVSLATLVSIAKDLWKTRVNR